MFLISLDNFLFKIFLEFFFNLLAAILFFQIHLPVIGGLLSADFNLKNKVC